MLVNVSRRAIWHVVGSSQIDLLKTSQTGRIGTSGALTRVATDVSYTHTRHKHPWSEELYLPIGWRNSIPSYSIRSMTRKKSPRHHMADNIKKQIPWPIRMLLTNIRAKILTTTPQFMRQNREYARTKNLRCRQPYTVGF